MQRAPRPAIYVLHENRAWVEPLAAALDARGLPWREWHLDEGLVPLDEAPPPGVFYNRMSASSHTRGHHFAPELTQAVLHWLEAAGRSVFNDTRALALEVSKVAQYRALAAFGLPVPRTRAAVGRAAVLDAARGFDGAPFITKHNRAGKGLGVELFRSLDGLATRLEANGLDDSRDGVMLVQAYIEAPAPFITRMEFIGGRFHYAVRVDTSEGFELCPADACQIGDAFCPAPGAPTPVDKPAKFSIVEAFDSPLIEPCERFLAANGITFAGIEFIVDGDGRPWVYDVNTNTNYNPDAETKAGRSGMGAIADFLGEKLRALG